MLSSCGVFISVRDPGRECEVAMRILICLKIVSQPQFTDTLRDEDTERLKSGELGINPADLYALELGLRVKDRVPGTTVTVITMGPQLAGHFLREAVSMGADQAAHVCDAAFVGSDTLVTAGVLAAAIHHLPPQDLILCGKKAVDSETGHIGPQLSVLLSLPLAANVTTFTAAEDGGLEVTCVRDGGMALFQGRMPALLTVCNGTEMVRRPTILGMRNARGAEIRLFGREDLQLDRKAVGIAGSPTRTVHLRSVGFRTGSNHKELDPDSFVDELAHVLDTRGKGACEPV